MQPARSLAGKALAAAGTTCPADLPFQVPKAAQAAQHWQLEQKPVTVGKSLRCVHPGMLFLSVRGFISGISRFVFYLSGVPCWREERVAFPLCLELFLRNKLICSVVECGTLLERGKSCWTFMQFVNWFICFFEC